MLVEDSQFDLDWASPESVRESLFSPWGALLLALLIRFVNGFVATALAVPLALAHEPNLPPRDSFGSGIGQFFDRLHLARAFKSLRWTHHVRRVALKRLGPKGDKLGRLDPILDIANIVSGLVAFVVIVYIGAKTAA